MGIIRRGDNTTTVICDACHEGHVEEVVLVESPPGSPIRAHIHCPEAGRVTVPLERLKQWVVDFDGLAGATAKGLDLAGLVEEVAPGRLWSLGKTTIGGRSRDVFLARGSTWIDAPGVFGACERLNASRGALVLVPGEIPPQDAWTGDPPDVVPLKLVARLEDARLTFDRDHLEGLLTGDRRKAPIKAQKTFPTPPGTRWDEVMVWVTDSTISIEAKRRSRDFSFQTAGFEEKRKRGVQDAIWALLKVFAMRGGKIPFDGANLDHNTRTNLKQYVSVLRQRIRALIPGIDGDPVPHVKDDGCYRMAFKIATREGVTFPVPGGTQWPNVNITLTRDEKIRIAVPTTERFAASSYVEEAGGDVHEWNAAEREAEREREYDLRMLGLADENGRPDARGAALIEVLRGNGTASRRADDKAMEDLCGVLSKLMAGIEGSPFDFAPSSKKWIARFQASAE
ncbi:MAG: hypothetical protein QN119_13735 [Armatimonadota bacterium]|nr:hypothetical protein [Armatimonadota bacterium]MDR7503255.1 hypothetical protein [Armatimonadota bacterium]